MRLASCRRDYGNVIHRCRGARSHFCTHNVRSWVTNLLPLSVPLSSPLIACNSKHSSWWIERMGRGSGGGGELHGEASWQSGSGGRGWWLGSGRWQKRWQIGDSESVLKVYLMDLLIWWIKNTRKKGHWGRPWVLLWAAKNGSPLAPLFKN